MKSLTIQNLSIQVDMPDDADPKDFAREAIEILNLSLQREPHGLAAQIFNEGSNQPFLDISVKDRDTEDSEQEETDMDNITTGLPINSVRDPEYSEIDQKRAVNALQLLQQGAEGDEEITLNGAECCEVVSMLKSRAYLHVVSQQMEGGTEYFSTP